MHMDHVKATYDLVAPEGLCTPQGGADPRPKSTDWHDLYFPLFHKLPTNPPPYSWFLFHRKTRVRCFLHAHHHTFPTICILPMDSGSPCVTMGAWPSWTLSGGSARKENYLEREKGSKYGKMLTTAEYRWGIWLFMMPSLQLCKLQFFQIFQNKIFGNYRPVLCLL